jgi:PIN domain nuclease of toxin-antitoxin system
VKLLLDMHVFLWLITADPRLSAVQRREICSPANECYLSAAAVWEATVKYQLGKLPLPDVPQRFLPRARHLHAIADLPIDEVSVLRLPTLPDLHKDPFDRMMVCQALEHGMTLVTVDPHIRQYPVPTL